jgi:hypothetical protein
VKKWEGYRLCFPKFLYYNIQISVFLIRKHEETEKCVLFEAQ